MNQNHTRERKPHFNHKNMLQDNSLIGFKYVLGNNNKYQKIFWLSVLTRSFCAVCFHCYNLIFTYFEYPTVEELSYVQGENIFPSVTVCNNEPVSITNLRRYINMSDKSNEYFLKHFSKSKRRDKFLFASVGRESSFKIGHRLKDLIVYCKFKGNDKCLHNETNWKLFQSSELFNCYTFFPYRLESENDELSLILYKESSTDQQIRGFTNPLYHRIDASNVMTFSIQSVGEMPDVIQKTISVQTGIKLSVILSGKKFTRAVYPHGNCSMGWNNKQFPVYSQFGAHEECRTLFYQKRCNCTLGYFYVPESVGKFCHNQTEDNECYVAAREYYNRNLPCFSPVWPCKEIQYDTVTYQSEWPDIKTMAFMMKKLVLIYNTTDSLINFYPSELGSGNTEHMKSVPLFNLIQVFDFNKTILINTTYIKGYINAIFDEPWKTFDLDNDTKRIQKQKVVDWIKSSFCKVYMRFLDNRMVLTQQKPKFQTSDLLAALGGCLGLWVGWSALTLVEILSFGVKLCQIRKSNNIEILKDRDVIQKEKD